MGAFGVVEQQGAGDGVQDRVGGAAGVAALQPGVVRDADPGQQRDLLAAQARDPADPGERGDLRAPTRSPSEGSASDAVAGAPSYAELS